jgi:hypothetical protein
VKDGHFSGPNCRVDGPEVTGTATATRVASDVGCVGLHCRADGSYLTTNNLFACLRPRRFHENEEVDMAVREWLRFTESDFYSYGIFQTNA